MTDILERLFTPEDTNRISDLVDCVRQGFLPRDQDLQAALNLFRNLYTLCSIIPDQSMRMHLSHEIATLERYAAARQK